MTVAVNDLRTVLYNTYIADDRPQWDDCYGGCPSNFGYVLYLYNTTSPRKVLQVYQLSSGMEICHVRAQTRTLRKTLLKRFKALPHHQHAKSLSFASSLSVLPKSDMVINGHEVRFMEYLPHSE